MADPVIVTCGAACEVTVVHELALPPLTLTLAEGAQITGAILLVWVVGFGFRALIRTLHVDENRDSDGSERD